MTSIIGVGHRDHCRGRWAVAMVAPFSYTKQVASDFGGTRNGMVIPWPAGILAKGELRSQSGHVIDIPHKILKS